MKVKDLIKELLDLPPDADVVIDTDDGMTGNYHELRRVDKKTNGAGEMFVVLNNDRGD